MVTPLASAPNDAFGALQRQRARAALASLFVGDTLAMPVHWYYHPGDIEQAFPGGIRKLEAAPTFHPTSIMSLHSTRQGGRSGRQGQGVIKNPEIIGEVILKGRRHLWDQSNRRYHHGTQAGDNTLNAHCARVLMRSLIPMTDAMTRTSIWPNTLSS